MCQKLTYTLRDADYLFIILFDFLGVCLYLAQLLANFADGIKRGACSQDSQ